MKLVVVESPTKAKTLSRFLGKEYEIMASMGHVRDLPKGNLAVDTSHDFAPQYEIINDKLETINKLKKAAKKSSQVILATDPDREGEAIAYHIQFICGNNKFARITFHEITKSAIAEALKNPGTINLSLVHAQQARRILDRLVGYKLSPLLWSKVRRGLSAGRVQSVALRFIVEREKEIAKFKKQEFWMLETELGKTHTSTFIASLYSKNNEKYERSETLELFAGPYKYQISNIKNKKAADEISKDLEKQTFIVQSVEEKEVNRQPSPPFITSTLQQAGHNNFGFGGKRTMRLAQRLYEEGFITYHRTDSFNLAAGAIKLIRDYVMKTYGQKYLHEETRVYKTRSKVAQEAHEAIRPTQIDRQLPEIEQNLGKDEAKLYDVIRRRSLATQMAAAKFSQTNADIAAGSYILKANGLRTLFDGFLKLYPGRLGERLLPKLEKDDKLNLLKVLPSQNFTTPPPRYNEASLVRTLESKGIGRPSTYAPIISLIQDRGYVEKKEGAFWPTAVGNAVIQFLTVNFDNIVDIPFTAAMEEDLDSIARGEKKWVPVLAQFYTPFEKKLESVAKNAQRIKIEVEKTGKICPKCKEGDVVIRSGKFGKFLSCSRFPACDWKDNYLEKVKDVKCPQCGADVVIRRSRKGKFFFGCAKWPGCKWASWRKPINNQVKTEEVKNNNA